MHRSVRPELRTSTLALLAALALAAAAHALAPSAARAFDCGRRLVVVGDPALYVRSVCGEPASLSVRTESRTVLFGAPDGFFAAAHTVSVQVETWIYDFGPRRFMQELTVVEGTVRSIRALGYGTSAGASRRAERGPPPGRGTLARRADPAHLPERGARSG